MFSEYASKFLSQSQLKQDSSSEAPLFYSAAELNESDEYNGLPGNANSVYNSRANWGSSFVPKYLVRDRPADSLGIHGTTLTNSTSKPQRTSHIKSYDELLAQEEEVDFMAPNNKWDMDSSTSTVEAAPTERAADSSTLHSVGFSQDGNTTNLSTANRAIHDSDEDDEPPEDIAIEHNLRTDKGDDAGLQESRYLPGMQRPFIPIDFLPHETPASEILQDQSDSYIPPQLRHPTDDMPKFDTIWGNVYLLMVAVLLSTSMIIWLRTDLPPPSVPLGDTMFLVIRASYPVLFLYSFIAVISSVIWVIMLRRFSHLLFYVSLVGVPVGLVFSSIYPLVMSYRSSWGGNSVQDKVMRWFSIVPLGMAVFWIYFTYKGRHALQRSLGIINLACSILMENRALMVLSCASVAGFMVATWIWMSMFAHVFMRGHTAIDHGNTVWVIDSRSWSLGAFYIFMYLWSWGVISGIQRSAASATVSQWYFYRSQFPQAPTAALVVASLHYSTNNQFGTICLSSLLCLLARLPLFFCPKRLVSIVQAVVYNFVSASVLSLTNPLALSNAVINSQGLVDSARTISTLRFIDQGYNNPEAVNGHSWTAYRLSKMILSAARGLAAMFLGIAAWTHAASFTNGGSVYGYMIGLMAAFIGWFVLGATEGTLSMIVDAAFVCFALDNAGQGGHCAEADRQFGGMP